MGNFQNFSEFRSDITASEPSRIVPPFLCDRRDLGNKQTNYMVNKWVMVKVSHKKGCCTTPTVGIISFSTSSESYWALDGVK